jgi:hypothetical protein
MVAKSSDLSFVKHVVASECKTSKRKFVGKVLVNLYNIQPIYMKSLKRFNTTGETIALLSRHSHGELGHPNTAN